MSNAKRKQQRKEAERQYLQRWSPAGDRESAMIYFKTHPENQLSETALRSQNITYWKNSFDQWLARHQAPKSNRHKGKRRQ